MLRLIRSATLALLVILAAPTRAGALEDDMVALDRAYIPALAITNRQPPPVPALVARAMDRLEARWKPFLQAHAGARASDPKWKADLQKIDGLIAAARRITNAGKDFAAAHEELEGVRITFLQMRERAGTPYYLDHLTRFHEVMEEIHGAASGKTGATFTDADLAKVKAAYPKAAKLWSTVTATKVDPVFRQTPEQQARTQKLLAAETQAMQALAAALEGGDRAAQAKAAQGIRQPFSALYISFGDFEGLESK